MMCVDAVACIACTGAYRAEPQGLHGQRRSLAANALAAWNGNEASSQAVVSNTAAPAANQVLSCVVSYIL